MSWGTAEWGKSNWGGLSQPVPAGGSPYVANLNPSVDAPIPAGQAIAFDVFGDNGPIRIIVYAEYPNRAVSELVFDRLDFAPLFRVPGSSFAAIDNGYHLQIARAGGWPDETFTLKILLVDALGNFVSTQFTWSVSTSEAQAAASVPVSKSKARDPLGFGLMRPFRRTASNDFLTGFGEPLVRACVGQVLATSPGELPWNPRFGTRLYNLRHLRNTETLPEIARVSIENALRVWEQRVTIVEVTAEPVVFDNRNRVELSLRYRIGNSSEQQIAVVT